MTWTTSSSRRSSPKAAAARKPSSSAAGSGSGWPTGPENPPGWAAADSIAACRAGAGDEAARDLLDENRDYRVAEVGVWLVRALADQSGHYTDPAARTAAVGSLPVPVRAHAALLAALARTGDPVDGDLEFVGRLAQANPTATNALVAWLDNTAAVKGGTT
ncbi:hypothetical protein ACFVG1_35180 [Streptomyces bacillaris]|uniref:hypothetical protein n=1 Tax=Streptomyces bacillaris TaxID=68179 RepID=UPI0035DE469D